MELERYKQAHKIKTLLEIVENVDEALNRKFIKECAGTYGIKMVIEVGDGGNRCIYIPKEITDDLINNILEYIKDVENRLKLEFKNI